MKELCLLFLVGGSLAQVPMTPGSMGPCPDGNCGPCPSGMTCPTGMPTAMPATGTDPSDGGEGGTPNPTEVPMGNPTGPPNNVNHPCRRYDLQCVRYFFKDHAHCKKPLGKVPEPYVDPLSNQFYPAFNATVTNVNAHYTGFNTGRIQDLYVNRETDKVVITIEFTNLAMNSQNTFIRFHRRAREPIITYGYGYLSYPSLLLTVTIPQVNDLRLDKSDSFAYANTKPIVELDPKLGESSDPIVARTLTAALADLQTLATENLFTQSSFFATVYIQNVICDFGLKIAPV